MEITIDLIFALIQAIVTAILGTFLKDSVVPSKWIPIQNIIVGLISSIVAIYFGIFTNVPTAIFICLAISLGVGGTYDAIQIKNK